MAHSYIFPIDKGRKEVGLDVKDMMNIDVSMLEDNYQPVKNPGMHLEWHVTMPRWLLNGRYIMSHINNKGNR